MALGFSGSAGGGDFKQVCKYNAKAGRMYRIDRVEEDGAFTNEEVEITAGFQAVFDMDHIEVGWAKFAKGSAPEWSMVKLGEPWPDRPSGVGQDGKPLFKKTFRLDIKLGASVGGDVREFASSAGCVIDAFNSLHNAYEAGVKDNAGKLPVVAMPNTLKMSGKGGDSNYAPVFEIVGWVDRARAFGDAPATEEKTAEAPKQEQAKAETKQLAAVGDEF
jgi:hypothetical protein